MIGSDVSVLIDPKNFGVEEAKKICTEKIK